MSDELELAKWDYCWPGNINIQRAAQEALARISALVAERDAQSDRIEALVDQVNTVNEAYAAMEHQHVGRLGQQAEMIRELVAALETTTSWVEGGFGDDSVAAMEGNAALARAKEAEHE